MAAMEWDEPGMKRNKNVRFRMGQGSNTVSYSGDIPKQALEIGRNPSGYNPNQVPAVRQSGLPSVTSRAALPVNIPPQTGFQVTPPSC